MTPTGNQDVQLKSLMEKANEEAQYIIQGNTSQVETRHTVIISIFPRLAWPLTCMSITEKNSKIANNYYAPYYLPL